MSVNEASSTVLNSVAVNGTLSITSGGGISQTPAQTITAGGAATFTAPTGSSINVGNSGNSFGSTVSFVGSGGNLQDVTVLDSSAFDVQALTINGNLNVTTTSGAITQHLVPPPHAAAKRR